MLRMCLLAPNTSNSGHFVVTPIPSSYTPKPSPYTPIPSPHSPTPPVPHHAPDVLPRAKHLEQLVALQPLLCLLANSAAPPVCRPGLGGQLYMRGWPREHHFAPEGAYAHAPRAGVPRGAAAAPRGLIFRHVVVLVIRVAATGRGQEGVRRRSGRGQEGSRRGSGGDLTVKSRRPIARSGSEGGHKDQKRTYSGPIMHRKRKRLNKKRIGGVRQPGSPAIVCDGTGVYGDGAGVYGDVMGSRGGVLVRGPQLDVVHPSYVTGTAPSNMDVASQVRREGIYSGRGPV
eukprot:1196147-Prorocentrum_minimum.AAC.4